MLKVNAVNETQNQRIEAAGGTVRMILMFEILKNVLEVKEMRPVARI